MRIRRPSLMFIALAGLMLAPAPTPAKAAESSRAPAIAALAYGYEDRDGREHGHPGWRDQRYSDAAIHEQAKRALWRTLGQRARYIDVGVRGGYVTLTGQVVFRRDRNAAYDAVAQVRGVRQVNNQIYVRRTYVGR